MSLDVNVLCVQFLVLYQEVNGKFLVYLDNVVIIQKLQVVIDVVSEYYCIVNSNVYWVVYYFSDYVIVGFEVVCVDLVVFINVVCEEVIFIKGIIEGINLVVQCLGCEWFQVGDEILIMVLEYYVNIVFWQQVCECIGVMFQVMLLCEDGSVDIDVFY